MPQDPEKLKALFGERPNLSYAAADVEDPAALKEALRGSRGVIFAASGKTYWSAAKVDYQARSRSQTAVQSYVLHQVCSFAPMPGTRAHYLICNADRSRKVA